MFKWWLMQYCEIIQSGTWFTDDCKIILTIIIGPKTTLRHLLNSQNTLRLILWQNITITFVKADIALHGNTISQLRVVTCHMGSHSVTCHPTQVNVPRLTPAMQAGTWFTSPGGVEGWVNLVDLIASRPLVEPATFRSRVRRRTTAPPRQPDVLWHCYDGLW